MEEQKDIFDFIEKRKVEMPDKAYFENLSKNVIVSQSKDTSDETQREAKIIPLYRRPITWMSAAAAAILVLIIVQFNGPKEIIPDESGTIAGLEDVSREEILAYVDENIDEFDVELIAEFVPANQLERDYSDLENEIFETEVEEDPIESISFDNITKDDILEYLEEEDLDFSDLDDEDSFI